MADLEISDAEKRDILDTLRLGWAMSELHGRYWQQAFVPGSARRSTEKLPPGFGLKLAEERPETEKAIRVQKVVQHLAGPLQPGLPGSSGSATAGDDAGISPGDLHTLWTECRAILESPTEGDKRDAWNRAEPLLRAWDCWIQDKLDREAPNRLAAYQLGRGLGDVWWGRVPEGEGLEQDDQAARRFNWRLLEKKRRDPLCHRLSRLQAYFGLSVARAMQVSIDRWGAWADDPDWRKSDASQELWEQVQLWRDFLLGDNTAESLLSRQTVVQKARKVRYFFRVFAIELITYLVSLVLVGVALFLLSLTSSGPWADMFSGVVAAFGLFGITVAGLSAKAKNTANNLVDRLRLTVTQELLAEQMTVEPPPRSPAPIAGRPRLRARPVLRFRRSQQTTSQGHRA